MTSDTNPPDDGFAVNTAEQRRVLRIVLVLNLVLAASLAIAGILADSNGALANALDNASDATVYAISLFAVGRSRYWKRMAAACSGLLLMVFAVGVVADAVHRFMAGSEPIGSMMMVMALIAAVVNLICLKLLQRLNSQDVNLRAAETFSLNDFFSNGGLLVAGALVAWTGQAWPDLLVGVAVAAIAAKGSFDILRDVRGSA